MPVSLTKKHMKAALLCGMLGCQLRGETVFPKGMAFTNVLILFALLKGLSLAMPVSAFRLGFTNGLMSESMILWFGIMLMWERRRSAA